MNGYQIITDCYDIGTVEVYNFIHSTIHVLSWLQKEQQGDVIVQYFYSHCKSRNQSYFLVSILAIQGLLLLLGVFLAWEIRKVHSL